MRASVRSIVAQHGGQDALGELELERGLFGDERAQRHERLAFHGGGAHEDEHQHARAPTVFVVAGVDVDHPAQRQVLDGDARFLPHFAHSRGPDILACLDVTTQPIVLAGPQALVRRAFEQQQLVCARDRIGAG